MHTQLQDQSEVSEATKPYDYPRFTYRDEEDFPDVLTMPAHCPFCERQLLPADRPEEDEFVDLFCSNEDCAFYRTAKLREVYRALRSAGWSIVDAAAMCLEHVQAEPERFTVDSASKADWVGKKIAQFQSSIARIRNLQADEIAAINARADAACRADERSLAFFLATFGPQLREFAESDRENWGGKKSLKLLYLTMGFKAPGAGRIVIDDERGGVLALDVLGKSECINPPGPATLKAGEVKKLVDDATEVDLGSLLENLRSKAGEDEVKLHYALCELHAEGRQTITVGELVGLFAHIETAGEKFSFEASLPTPTTKEVL